MLPKIDLLKRITKETVVLDVSVLIFVNLSSLSLCR